MVGGREGREQNIYFIRKLVQVLQGLTFIFYDSILFVSQSRRNDGSGGRGGRGSQRGRTRLTGPNETQK